MARQHALALVRGLLDGLTLPPSAPGIGVLRVRAHLITPASDRQNQYAASLAARAVCGLPVDGLPDGGAGPEPGPTPRRQTGLAILSRHGSLHRQQAGRQVGEQQYQARRRRPGERLPSMRDKASGYRAGVAGGSVRSTEPPVLRSAQFGWRAAVARAMALPAGETPAHRVSAGCPQLGVARVRRRQLDRGHRCAALAADQHAARPGAGWLAKEGALSPVVRPEGVGRQAAANLMPPTALLLRWLAKATTPLRTHVSLPAPDFRLCAKQTQTKRCLSPLPEISALLS